MPDIYSGMNAAPPHDIAALLGGMDINDHGEAISNLTGALMTLCRSVAELQQQVADLQSDLLNNYQRIDS